MAAPPRTRPPAPPPDWELVYKRNPVERLKRDKSPLGILDELPALIAAGYEQVPEEDMVRLKWWGLYHDKPKVGTFMLRIKLPGGHVSPAGLRAIGGILKGFGRGEGGGRCGAAAGTFPGSPVGGLGAGDLFDAQPVVDEAAAFFYGNPEYSNLP